MLELRPRCEYSGKPLPPDSLQDRIYSLGNVCPDCGAGRWISKLMRGLRN